MAMEKPDFIPQRLSEERAKDKSKVITVRLNIEELRALEASARLLRQEKLSTVLKQLADLGQIVLHSPQTSAILGICFNNDRRNKRIGLDLIDPTFEQM